jgi:hypothetical protein
MKKNEFQKRAFPFSSAFVFGLVALSATPSHANAPGYPYPQMQDPMQGQMQQGQVYQTPSPSGYVPYQPGQPQPVYVPQAAYAPPAAYAPQVGGSPYQGGSPYYAPQQMPATVIGSQPQQPPVAMQQSPYAPPSMAAEPVIEGFADQVPLTVALQQILPQGYGYALGDGVNPGQLVSWRGGRPWNAVLQDMLSMSSLGYIGNDRLITITALGPAPAVISNVSPIQQQMQMQQAMPQDVPLAPMPGQPQPQAMMEPMQEQAPVLMTEQPVMVSDPTLQSPIMQPQPLQIENPPIFVPQIWETRPGQTLRQLLQEWCGRVNVEMNWTAEYDYPVMASMSMTGTFEEAVRVLLSGFDAAKPTPRARLHYNPAAGQSILIVEASGNHYGD